MKILMVTRESHADKRYGLGKSLTPIILQIQARGIEVGYLCQADAGLRGLTFLRKLHSLAVKYVGRFFTETEFVPLLWGILERLNMGRLAAHVMVRDHYTHVHCHDPIIAAGYRWFARIRWFAQLRRGHTARWGVTEHGFGCYAEAFHIDGARLGTGVMRWLRRWEAKILLKAHWVMTPTQVGLSQLARDLSIYPIPSTWYAIPHPRPQLTRYSKEEARHRLGWREDTLYIIAVGRFAPLKQFPALVQAVAQLPATHVLPPWQLVLIGEGERAPLQTLANELGIADRLLFAVSDDMGLYYSAADIYVSPTLTESFGLANLEAVIMGLPAICTAVGGVPEVVGSGACLIPAQATHVLTHVLHTFLENSTLRHHWAQQATHWIQAWPEANDIAERYLAMYQGQPLPSPPAPLPRGEGPGVRADISPSTTPPHHPSSPLPNSQPHINSSSLSTIHYPLSTKSTPPLSLCPLPRPLELPKQAKILVIAPHPDDETLGCGGTLALLRQQGCTVKVIIVADGKQGDPQGYLSPGTDIVRHRQQESLAAMHILGIEEVTFLGQPDGQVQYTSELSKLLLDCLSKESADWLFIPSLLDYHRDHVAISLAIVEAWQQHGCRERLFLYETWAPVPATWVVDISTVFALKQQATLCYALPLKYCDYLTACTGMANYRGLYLVEESQGQYAEAFLELMAENWEEVLMNLWRVREFQEKCLRG